VRYDSIVNLSALMDEDGTPKLANSLLVEPLCESSRNKKEFQIPGDPAHSPSVMKGIWQSCSSCVPETV
jgi:hypothetical protein